MLKSEEFWIRIQATPKSSQLFLGPRLISFDFLVLQEFVCMMHFNFCLYWFIAVLLFMQINCYCYCYAKPEVHLSQSTNELATKFQRLYTCFEGSRLNCAICIGKSNIAVAKPEIHILKYKYIHVQIQRIVVVIQCCEIDRQQLTSAATSLIR